MVLDLVVSPDIEGLKARLFEIMPDEKIEIRSANGAVVMPSFEDGKDGAARDTIAACFPGRELRQVPALDIVHGGGGIHCITQQQPKAVVEIEES